MKKDQSFNIPTLGYTRRRNFFITMLWPQKNIVWNCFKRRRNIEFRKHLSHLAAYAKRCKLRKLILFIDRASYHDTPAVRKFFREHRVFRRIFLGKKDPNSNPVEGFVNKRFASWMVNRSFENEAELENVSKKFTRRYNSTYAT